MPTSSFNVEPLKDLPVVLHEADIVPATFTTLTSTETKAIVGLAASYKKCQLDYVALATTGGIVVINMCPATRAPPRMTKGRCLLRDFLIGDHRFVGFNLDRLAIALYHDAGLFIRGAIDIQSALKPLKDLDQRSVTAASMLPDNFSSVKQAFRDEDSKSDIERRLVAERARVSLLMAQLPGNLKIITSAVRIDTTILDVKVLEMLAKTSRDHDRLEALKPTHMKNDFSQVVTRKDGSVEIHNTRYKTKVRVGTEQRVVLDMGSGSKITARAKLLNGKRTTIATSKKVVGNPRRIHTFGKEDPTGSEVQRRHAVNMALQGVLDLGTKPVIRKLWFQRSPEPSRIPSSRPKGVAIPLNNSQSRAVSAMLAKASVKNPGIVLVQGPPGTGKTSVITGVVQGYVASGGKGLWLVAQSNVAVKNMAEKLGSIGFFEWKLLVSKDFHFEWHEHLYERLEQNVVISGNFPTNSMDTDRLLGNTKVILCTLSMLTNARVALAGFQRLVPVDTLIIDEASQIELGDYLPAFIKFSRSLRKVGFVGDDKQLAPFGQDDLKDLRSVFDVEHITQNRIFLNIQYRMPPAIGQFISNNVYDGKLLSNPQHTVRSNTCCRFVEIIGGEEKKAGHSWENIREVELVVHMVRQLINQGRERNFRIITPYEAQHNRIEAALKAAALPWEDRCFVLDSFQGNEADYIIISVVRTVRPGFLQNTRRTNVMLTRCKKGMAILSQKKFLASDLGRDTLVGKLAAGWSAPWITSKEVLNHRRVFD